MKKIKIFIILLISFISVYMIFVKSSDLSIGIKYGILLSGTVLVPSLFPFMALCCFLIKTEIPRLLNKYAGKVTGAIFGLPGASASAFIFSFIGGYPIGAKMLKNLYRSGCLTHNQAKKASYFCVGAGPAFLVLAIGSGMFKSTLCGIILLISNLFASFITAIFCGQIIKCEKNTPVSKTTESIAITDCFVEGVAEASSGMISICAFTVLFSGIISVLNGLSCSWCSIVLDVTTGVSVCAQTNNLILAAAVTGFGGISVICQILSVAGEIKPNLFKFLIIRILNGGVSAFITFVILCFFPITEETFGISSTPIPKACVSSLPFSIALILLSITFIAECYLKSHKRLVDFF